MTRRSVEETQRRIMADWGDWELPEQRGSDTLPKAGYNLSLDPHQFYQKEMTVEPGSARSLAELMQARKRKEV